MDKIAILIINHETPDQVNALKNHIETHFISDNYDLTIVDNSKWFPFEDADIKNSFNRGFDQVVIDWLKHNKPRNYAGYWTLNSDCLLKPMDYTEDIIKYLNGDSQIGMVSTLIHETKGWGNTDALQHPQNIKTEMPAKIGYIDFQSAIISRSLLQEFIFDNNLVYYLGGLDMDFNMLADSKGMFKILLPHLEIIHLGAQSYREPTGELITERVDEIVKQDELNHIDRFHLSEIASSGTLLMEYGFKQRYGMDIFVERSRMIQTPTTPYTEKGEMNELGIRQI